MRIFYINGIALAGKDTFVINCGKYIPVGLTSTVDKVKELCREHFGWDGVKDEAGRQLLASVRMAWTNYNKGPVKEIQKKLTEFKLQGIKAVFVMVREYPEMMYMKNLLGGDTLLVLPREGLEVGPTEQAYLDMVPSDYEYDYEIDNTGDLEELDEIARKFCELHISGK